MDPVFTLSENTSIGQALSGAVSSGLERLDSQLLLGHVLKRDRAWLMAHAEEALQPAEAADFLELCGRRSEGVPVAYLLGTWAFYGLALEITPAVLVPRPETEVLVDWALELLREAWPANAPLQVIDLGTGSGAIALALKARCPQAEVTGTDASAPALAVAQGNAKALGLDVRFRQGDWWSAVPGQRYGLALSNPPYIAAGDVHLQALRHEPEAALTPGGDGLDAYRTLQAQASDHLLPGAWLLFEHGWDQAEAVRQLFSEHGFESISSRTDWSGRDRCTGARWKSVAEPAL